MNRVFEHFTDKTRLMFLCESRGYIIDLTSSPEILQQCFKMGITQGACLDYYSFGTNSISMARNEGCATTIIGDEHYCNIMKSWSCIAAPIRVYEEIRGYIDISDQADSDLMQLIPLVVLMADLIEERVKTVTGEKYHLTDDKYNLKGEKSRQTDGIAKVDKVEFFGKLILTSSSVLTKRELEVLYSFCHGKRQQDIADELSISINALKSHFRKIFQKLGANSRNDCERIVAELLQK